MYYEDGDTQNTTVGGDQRQEHAKCLVKSRRNLFQDDLDHLNQRGDDQDKADGLHKAQSELIQDIFLHQESNDGCDRQHECYCCTHTGCRFHLLRYAQERTDTQELRQHYVVDEYGCDKY